MGYATLGFPDGPAIQFRIDPQEIGWGFKINTSVTPTVGGRVVQVNGATLSDITISGLFGEDRSRASKNVSAKRQAQLDTDPNEHAGRSWRLAKAFSNQVRVLMEYQAQDNKNFRKMHAPAVFSYPPNNWRFMVFIKAFGDPDGGTLTIGTGKFSHGYQLTLFVVQEGSDVLVKAGSSNGVLNKERRKAINDYIGRISEGIGWKPSIYNGNFIDYWSRGTAFSQQVNDTESFDDSGVQDHPTDNLPNVL